MPEPSIDALAELFRAHFGAAANTVTPLKGDGSDRKLFRMSDGRHTAIGAVNPDERENRAFIEFSRHFRSSGLPVPEIYAEALDKGIYLEEDLGDTTLFEYLSENRTGEKLSDRVIDVYKQVVAILPQFQVTAGKTLDYQFCYPRSSFDKKSMMWDLNYFKYYFLRLSHVPFNEQGLEDDFERLAEFLLETDRDFFLYRDFQSRNVMIRDGSPYFVDYQGGRKGALQYDIASLLSDAKADLPFDVRSQLLDRYLEVVQTVTPIAKDAFMKYYYGYVYIRIMQALGAYGLRGFYERKPRFLQSIPYAIRNLEFLLRTVDLPVDLPELMRVFKRMVASSQLRQFGEAELNLTVRIQSFSYRHGMPADESGHGGGYIFDCRALPNPGKLDRFAKMTGKDAEVVAFLEKEPAVRNFTASAFQLIDQSVVNYQDRNFTDLMVAFGCTGGQHRSVYCAELLAKHLRDKFKVKVELSHREAALHNGNGR